VEAGPRPLRGVVSGRWSVVSHHVDSDHGHPAPDHA
jgi:hypothetical protein